MIFKEESKDSELPSNQEFEFKYMLPKEKSIEKLEAAMLSMPQLPCSVVHKFGPGIYMRELYLPAGALVIGHHQKFEHVNVFIKGRLTFFEEDGTRKELVAPMTFIGKPGRKTAYVNEDSIFMNVYATNETDIEKLESHFLTKSETWLDDKSEKEKALLITSDEDKNDYLKFLEEFSLTEEYVRKISEEKSDMITLPYGNYKIKTAHSKIEGVGLFATGDIESNEMICLARMGLKRTLGGRYTNHSSRPNAKMIKGHFNDILLVATRRILGCQGGQDGEEITVDYRDSMKLNLQIGGLKCQQSQ